jgi:hypothetical protein
MYLHWRDDDAYRQDRIFGDNSVAVHRNGSPGTGAGYCISARKLISESNGSTGAIDGGELCDSVFVKCIGCSAL